MLKKVLLTNIVSGKTVEVFVEADSDERAILASGKAPNETAKVQDVSGIDEWLIKTTSSKPSLDERVAFFAGLARCLDRNISTLKSLQLIAGQMKSPRYRGAIAEIASDISSGDRFSDALAKHPDLFSDETLALVRAGEESGRLSEIFYQIANSQKKTLRILKKLKSGLIYPAIVLVLAVVVVIVMSFTLVPAISKLYSSMNVKLPLATIIMIGFSNILLKQPWLAILPFVGLYYFFKNWGKIYSIPSVQKFFVGLPTVGKILQKAAATVCFRVLATLLQANVRILTALEITAASAPLIDYREFFLRVRVHISEGSSLPEAFLQESHWLGSDGRIISALVQISAETGSANELLEQLASDYEEELDNISNQIDKIIEPFTLVTMGAIVGFLIYAIYGPIFNLSNVVLPKKPGQQPPAAQVPR
ncbi:MAG: type II secretion system F family protein [Chthoniobacterales bacterium]|nr:type II secretion system F family protein [Chthoniobacterales bacterium]